MSDPDVELLRRYAESHAEDAFTELVRRRLPLVYSVALRQCAGDVELASEVTQRVFADLARKAGALSQREVLIGWLHRSARFAASDAVRAQRRRRAREEEAIMMNQIPEDSAHDAEWRALQPVLDDAMSDLSDADRDAVMLRFFENQGFREVGVALRLSEDAARMRVERALEKLRRLLARRGITSTAAALGLALANQAGATPPVGLVASVATAAVSGVGGGGGVAALFSFMSTLKTTGGALGVTALLLLSLSTNVWLGTLPSRAVTVALPPTSPASAASGSTHGTTLAAPSSSIATPTTELPPGVELAALSEDPAQMRDRLRAAGVSPALTRAIVEGLLRRQYREKLSEQRVDQARNNWWRQSWSGQMDRPPPMADDRGLMQTMVFDRLEELFGPDPAEMALYEARFDFLSPEIRRVAIALEREANRASLIRPGYENGTSAVLEAEARKEQRAQFLDSLSPGERAEYDLRLISAETASRMNQIAASETEARAILGIVDNPGAPSSRTLDPTVKAARDQKLMQDLVEAVGFDRALDYVWSGAAEYAPYARVAQTENLPASTAGKVMQLAAETTARAIAISRDAALDADQKLAAARALQESVRPQLDAVFPPAAQARLPDDALLWFNALAKGEYRRITSRVSVDDGILGTYGTNSVTAPVPPHIPVPPHPQRPAR